MLQENKQNRCNSIVACYIQRWVLDSISIVFHFAVFEFFIPHSQVILHIIDSHFHWLYLPSLFKLFWIKYIIHYEWWIHYFNVAQINCIMSSFLWSGSMHGSTTFSKSCLSLKLAHILTLEFQTGDIISLKSSRLWSCCPQLDSPNISHKMNKTWTCKMTITGVVWQV